MHLLIVLPKQPEATGNFVTARRLQSGLQKLGIAVELFAIDSDNAADFTTIFKQFRPDQLLLLHAWRSGRFWLENETVKACPASVLLTGTDINQDITDPAKKPVVEQVLQQAAAVVSQNQQTVDNLRKQNPAWIDRLRYIPPGVVLGTTDFPLRKILGINEHSKLFLHPAGIRPVKANLELLELCDKLAQDNQRFVLAFCGPVLDQSYFALFIEAIRQRPWAHYLGVIPPDAMSSAMSKADIILNHSISEGASNALLEALAVGRPVLARNIHGNASIDPSGHKIFLYNSDDEFFDFSKKLLHSPPSATIPDDNSPQVSFFIEAENFAELLQCVRENSP